MTALKKINIVEYIAWINLQFPNTYQFLSDKEREMFVDLWYEGLKEYPKEVCDAAVKQTILNAEFAPKIATVRKHVQALFETQDDGDGELWNKLLEGLESIRHSVPYTTEKYNQFVDESTGMTAACKAMKKIAGAYDALNSKTREYLGGVRAFMDLSQLSDEELTYEKGRFLKALPTVAQRIKLKAQTPPLLANMIKELALEMNGKRLIGDKHE